MKCLKCPQQAVIDLQHGGLCQSHFLLYFEEKVFRTIKKYRLIGREDKVCVAVSGGKDSLTVLYLTQKYLQKNNRSGKALLALAINEGIKNYREKTLKDLNKFCREKKILLKIIKSRKEWGYTLDGACPLVFKRAQIKPCHVCGVWRRYLLNKYAWKWGATKVVTGHNLDDEAQAIVMNLFKANVGLAAHLGPVSGVEEHQAFIQRVKPLYFCPEKEVRLYALLKKFPVTFAECPYAEKGYRAHIQKMLNDFEQEYRGTKQGIISSFLDVLPLLKERAQRELQGKREIESCARCGEPCRENVCRACKILDVLKIGKKNSGRGK